MKKFKGNRPLNDIDKKMEALGMMIYKEVFQKGGDYVAYKGDFYNVPATIIFNVATGWFEVINGFTGEQIATHLSTELDNEKWYSALLDILYLPED